MGSVSVRVRIEDPTEAFATLFDMARTWMPDDPTSIAVTALLVASRLDRALVSSGRIAASMKIRDALRADDEESVSRPAVTSFVIATSLGHEILNSLSRRGVEFTMKDVYSSSAGYGPRFVVNVAHLARHLPRGVTPEAVIADPLEQLIASMNDPIGFTAMVTHALHAIEARMPRELSISHLLAAAGSVLHVAGKAERCALGVHDQWPDVDVDEPEMELRRKKMRDAFRANERAELEAARRESRKTKREIDDYLWGQFPVGISDSVVHMQAEVVVSPTAVVDSPENPAVLEKQGETVAQRDPEFDTEDDCSDAAEAELRLRWEICDVEALIKAHSPYELEGLSSKDRERKRVVTPLLENPIRMLPALTETHLDLVYSLSARFPNFRSAVEQLVLELELPVRMGGPLYLPPILLLGPPGVGKTLFAQELAKLPGFHAQFRSMAEATSGFAFTGSHPTWAEARPGWLASLIADLPDTSAAMLILDEIDKARKGEWATDRPLLGLLEPSTAGRFRDEFLGIELDLRPVTVICTANRLEDIRPEVRSRLRIFDIPEPNQDEMQAVVHSVDGLLRERRPEIAALFEPLPDAVVARIAMVNPRKLERVLRLSYALSAKRQRNVSAPLRLTGEDIPIRMPKPLQRERQRKTETIH